MPGYTIVDYFGYNLPPPDRMRAIREADFNGVILLWADYFDSDYKRFPEYAEKEGLYVENAHAPYKQSNTLWQDSLEGQEYTSHIIRCIEDCASYQIPTLVVHPANGQPPLPLGNTGLERFKKIIDAAEKHGINLAVENQGNPEYIDYVFKNLRSDRLGFCFDSGHENCYSPALDLLDLYGDKLMALHLHDNNAGEDSHALPFTGTVDWNKISRQLTTLDYQGAIALEILNKGFEPISDPVDFLRIALERAGKIG